MDVFYALAEPNRRKIIQILAERGQLSATEISEGFKISPQAVSQHLKILLESKLLSMQRNAQQRIYRLDPATIHKVEEWVQETERLWDKRLDRLDRVLEEEKKNAKKQR